MKLPARVLVQWVILLGALALAAPAAQEPAPKYPVVETGVVFYETAEGPYIFIAKIVDVETDELMHTPYLEVPAGKEASMEDTLAEHGNIRLHFWGRVAADRKTARYTVRLEQKGQVFAEHSANVSL